MAALEVIGTIGGAFIALSLVPQVMHTYKIKKAVMKYVYDKEEARNGMILKEEGPTQHSVESTTTKASEEDVSDMEAANAPLLAPLL
eukprot:scaffold9211_cov183-Skeletonema_dohrnii-CCMP3373.AAC.5